MKNSVFLFACIILLAVLACAACGSQPAAPSVHADPPFSSAPPSQTEQETQTQAPAEKKPLRFVMLIGTHNELAIGKEGNADRITHMVFCIDPNENAVRVMNLSMSTGIEDKGRAKDIILYDHDNGEKKTAEAVADLLGIPLARYAVLSLRAVPYLFDSLGPLRGVEIGEEFIHNGWSGINSQIVEVFGGAAAEENAVGKAGTYDLNGIQTVGYFLSAPAETENMDMQEFVEAERVYIARRNRQILAALKDNLRSASAEQLISLLKELMNIRGGIHTNVSLKEWIEIFAEALPCAENPVDYMEFPEKGGSYYRLQGNTMEIDPAQAKKVAAAFFKLQG